MNKKYLKTLVLLVVFSLSMGIVHAADFKTQLVKMTIAASTDSVDASAPTDFDSVDADSTIALISGVTQHAMGWTATSNQAPDDTSARVELVNGSTLRATRSSTIAETDTVWVLLIEYTGDPGGDNEFIVRDATTNSWSSGTTTDSYGPVSSVVNTSKVVVFNAGTENPNTGNSQYDRGDVRAYLDSSKNVQLARGDGSGAIDSNHQVVEFTGSNWEIQTGDASPAQDPSGTDVTISDVGDTSDVWVYFNWDTNRANLDERGHRVWLTSTTNLRVQEHASATAGKTVRWYVIKNEDMNVQTGAADNQFSGSTSASITGFTAVSDLDRSFAWVSGMTNGGGNAHPRDLWQAELSDTSTISLLRGRSGQNLDYRYFVVELPEGEVDLTPTASASANPTSGLEPLNVDFNGTGTGGNAPLSYFWQFGDGSNSTSEDPSHTYTSFGTYNATLTVTDDDGDSDVAHVIITVDEDLTPTANASATPTSGLEPLEVDFTGVGTGGNPPLTYFWNFTDGGTSTDQNPTYTFNNDGVYVVELTVTDDDGDSDTDTVTITVDEDLTPSAFASANPTSGLEPLNVDFNGTGTGGNAPLSYFWQFGDGTNSTSEDPSHTYTSFGTYNATLTVTDDDGDSDVAHVVITVDEDLTPTANASATPLSGLEPLNVSFTGVGTGGNGPLSYFWNFTDGGTSTEQNPSHVFVNDGIYFVELIVTDNDGDSDSDTVTITVDEDTAPLANATASPQFGNAPLTVNFTGFTTSGNAPFTYFWNFTDGFTSTEQNPQHTFNSSGLYTVELTITDDDGDTGSDTALVQVF